MGFRLIKTVSLLLEVQFALLIIRRPAYCAGKTDIDTGQKPFRFVAVRFLRPLGNVDYDDGFVIHRKTVDIRSDDRLTIVGDAVGEGIHLEKDVGRGKTCHSVGFVIDAENNGAADAVGKRDDGFQKGFAVGTDVGLKFKVFSFALTEGGFEFFRCFDERHGNVRRKRGDMSSV